MGPDRKEMLLRKLAENGWDVASRETRDEWWAAEQWTLRSNADNWGSELLLIFLVDPQSEDRTKDTAVWAVTATTVAPQFRIDAENQVAQLAVTRKRYDEELRAFVEALVEYRRST